VVNDEERALRRQRLGAIADRVMSEVPGCAIASDQNYREADLAIDFREDVPPLALGDVQRIVEIMQSEGLTAKASSIHVNGWFGGYDKLSTTRLMMREEFAIDLDAARGQFVFAGDSPNDQPMFAYFENSVGVANVRRFEAVLRDPPRYVAKNFSGDGFTELAGRLLGES
jgi:hydroxymethylpyrimidine pyrophosphatase-like HAD family hydrolase